MDSQQFNNLENQLQLFEPITLVEMESVSLMNRRDMKFVLEINFLPIVLNAIQPFYKSLEINGKRFFNYKTDYFDTSDFQMFTAHSNQKQNRFKVRYREYLGSNVSFLEVKFKNNKGRTLKSRISSWVGDEIVNPIDIEFLQDKIPFSHDQLVHALTNEFTRITLVNKKEKERLTVDFSLRFNKENGSKKLPNLVIIEVKQEEINLNSKVVQVLRKYGIRQARFSKYVSGAILLNKRLKYNQFKSNMLYLNKIHKNYGVIWNR